MVPSASSGTVSRSGRLSKLAAAAQESVSTPDDEYWYHSLPFAKPCIALLRLKVFRPKDRGVGGPYPALSRQPERSASPCGSYVHEAPPYRQRPEGLAPEDYSNADSLEPLPVQGAQRGKRCELSCRRQRTGRRHPFCHSLRRLPLHSGHLRSRPPKG